MVKRPNQTDALAAKLAELIGKDIKIFDEKEAKALAELAEMQIRSPGAISTWVKFFETAQSMGKFGTSIQNIVKWFIYMATAWIAFKAGVVGAILSVVKGQAQ